MTRRILGLFLAVALVPAGVLADDLHCTGQITGVSVYSGGEVAIYPTWRNAYVAICSLNTTVGNVTPATCRAWLAAALLQQQTKTQNATGFANASYTCATAPTYMPTVTYFTGGN